LKALELDWALFNLIKYYNYSKGKRARQIVSRLETAWTHTVQANPDDGPRERIAPRNLVPMTEKDLPIRQVQRVYWTTVLRPLLADNDFLNDLAQYDIKSNSIPDYIIKDKHKAVEFIENEDLVSYFDDYFDE